MNKKLNKGKKRASKPRSTPLFVKKEQTVPKDTKDLVYNPETPMDVARLLRDEILSRWPEVVTPQALTGKHQKLIKDITQEFTPSQLRDMVRILVWDFDCIKHEKAFYPPSSHLTFPWLDQLYNYKYALASAIGKGVTTPISRVSKYSQRYIAQTEELSFEEIAKRKNNGVL